MRTNTGFKGQNSKFSCHTAKQKAATSKKMGLRPHLIGKIITTRLAATTMESGRLPEPDEAMRSGYVLPNGGYYTESAAEMQIGLSVQGFPGC